MAEPWWKQSPFFSNLYGIAKAATKTGGDIYSDQQKTRYGMAEAVGTVGGGMLSQSGAGLAGLGGWLSGASPEERARIVDEAMRQSPYLMQPSSEAGQAMVQGLGYLMSPVQKAGDWLATASEQAGGGPLAMSVAKTLPDALLWGAGTPSMLRGGAAVSRGAEALTGRVADMAATGPSGYRAQSGARPVYGPAQSPAPAPALLPGGGVQPIPAPGPGSPLQRWGRQAGALYPETEPNPFYENLGTAIRNRPGAENISPSQRPFYSVLYDAVEQLPNKGTPQEMVSILKKNGVKQAEIDAFLLPELFSGQWIYDPDARDFTENYIVEDLSTGALAPNGGAPKFVTKQQIKHFISPGTETNPAGPAAVFDVQQWRRGQPNSGVQKLMTEREQAQVEKYAISVQNNQNLLSNATQALTPEIDSIRSKFQSKYPNSLFKDNYDISDALRNSGRYPYQLIGINGFELAFAKQYPDTPLKDGNDIGVVESAFRQIFRDINEGEDYQNLTYADWVYAAERLGFSESNISRAEEWFDQLPRERKNFVATYFEAAIEAQEKLGNPLQDIQDINESIEETFTNINKIQRPQHAGAMYGMTQLLDGPAVDRSVRPGALQVSDTSLETGLLVPTDWANTILGSSYHMFPAGTVAFNRTTQRPLHLSSDPSVLSQNSTRFVEQLQSDINQRATTKLSTGRMDADGTDIMSPIGYLMGRVPQKFMSEDFAFPQLRGDVLDSDDFREPNTLKLASAPPRLPFSDTGQWSRLGIAQAFADAIEAGDDAVSISSPTQHMLAHQGQFIGSMRNDQSVFYVPNLDNYSQTRMSLDAFESGAPKELKAGAKEWTFDSVASNVQDFIIQNTRSKKTEPPLWLRKEINRVEELIKSDENIPAFGEAGIKHERYIDRLKEELLGLQEHAEKFRLYESSFELNEVFRSSFFKSLDQTLKNMTSTKKDGEYTQHALIPEGFDQLAKDLSISAALEILKRNGFRPTQPDIAALEMLGMESNVISLKAGKLYPKPKTAAAGLSKFYGENLKSTLGKFAKEIDPASSIEVGGIPMDVRENGLMVEFSQDVYTVKITDKMREQYRNKGFKLFTPALAGGYLMEQTLRTELEKRRKAMLED